MSGQPALPVPSGRGPQHTASSHNSLRSKPTGSQATTPILTPSQEDHTICRSTAEAAESLRLVPGTFPTLFAPPAFSNDLSEGERQILPVIAALVSKVHHLTSEVALLKAAAPPASVPAPSQADHLITAALQDLTSKVTSLAVRPPPTPLATSSSAQPPPPPPKKKPLLILSHLGNLTALLADFPILVWGQWYSSPESYARDYNDSREADIFFASVNPTPINQHFVHGPPPGYTVVPSSLPPKSDSWAQVVNSSKKAGKRATATQVTLASATRNSEVDKPTPPLPTAQRQFYAPRLHPVPLRDPLNMSAALPDVVPSVLRSAGCTLPLSFSASVNTNGAVTLTANLRTPATAYSSFFLPYPKILTCPWW